MGRQHPLSHVWGCHELCAKYPKVMNGFQWIFWRSGAWPKDQSIRYWW